MKFFRSLRIKSERCQIAQIDGVRGIEREMRKLVLFVLVMIVGTIIATAADSQAKWFKNTIGEGTVLRKPQSLKLQPAWVKIAPAGGQFSIMMPAAPRTDVKTNNTPLGVATTNLSIYQTEHGWFGVTWTVYPPTMKIEIQTELDATRDNFIKAVNGTLLDENKVFQNGVAGTEFTVESQNSMLTSRIFVVGSRTYQLAVAFPKGENHAQDIDQFLSSFQLVKT